tara:strand:+ start:1766 stop:3457 length:1692 start_codon:yes stop_codon:yes gene_type:complete
MKTNITKLKSLTRLLLAPLCLLFLSINFIGCEDESECDNETAIETDYVDTEHTDFSDIIEGYNAQYNSASKASNNQIKTNVYVDLSDGITKFALADQNNKKLLKQFFLNVQSEENLNFYELSDDSVIEYKDTQAISYFTNTGHKDTNGNLKQGAPIDRAFNIIAEGDDLGIVITDGELYDSQAKQVSTNAWASNALKQWFGKNGSLEIISTNFTETNSGNTYKKHMYLLVFIPSTYDGSFVELMKTDFKTQGIEVDSNTYSTDVSDLYEREYINSQSTGTTALNDNGILASLYLDGKAFEYVDFTGANALDDWDDWFDSGQGIIAYTRDGQNSNTGKEENFPLFEKLFIDLNAIDSYEVNNVKIKVSNVTENFNLYKKNFYAKRNKPDTEKTNNGEDSLDVNNFLVFNKCFNFEIDGEMAYDTDQKLIADTKEDYSKMLKANFKFKSAKIDNEIKDFIFLDNEEGMNNHKQGQKYEVVLKFDKNFNYNTKGLTSKTDNIIKVDVYVDEEDFTLKEIKRENLTWDKIDDSGEDQTLFVSLRNVLNNNKPKSILYTYYIELGPFK